MVTRVLMFLNSGSLTARRTRVLLWIGLALLCLCGIHGLGVSWGMIVTAVLLGLAVWACIKWRSQLGVLSSRLATKRVAEPVATADPMPTTVLPVVPTPELTDDDQLTIYTSTDSLSWLFMARHIWKLTVSCLLYLLALIALQVWAPFGGSGWMTALIVVSIVVLAPIYIYNFKREKFRKQQTQVYVQGDDVVIKFPDSRLYGFAGGCPTLSIERIDTVSIDPRSFWRMFFFRKVRNMTIDSASDKDGAFNHLIDLKNADEIRDAIRARKWAINHG